MITLAKTPCPRAANEWAPPAPAHIRAALSPRALYLYLEVQAHGDGFHFPCRELAAKAARMTIYAYREAIAELTRLGLYLVECYQDAKGRWSKVCTFLTSSPQVEPRAGLPEVGDPALIPPSTERKRAGGHTPETCQREARGLPCPRCGKVRRARELLEAKAAAAEWRAARLFELEQRAARPAVVAGDAAPAPVRAWAMDQIRRVLTSPPPLPSTHA